MRLLHLAEKQGQVVLVVMPVTPIYHREFLTPTVTREFEEALTDVQRLCPAAKLVRLDQVPELYNDDLFWDTVHLNMYGQQIATESFVSHFKTLAVSRSLDARP